MKYSIGIDIGGTNTDAVLINAQKEIIAWHKTTTTNPVDVGVERAIATLRERINFLSDDIVSVCVGTTHATNALLEQKSLYKVGVIRISSGAGATIPSCYQWPERIKETLYVGTVTISGGFECDGTAIRSLSEHEIERAVHDLYERGMQACAVVGVFSCLNNEQELGVKTSIQRLLSDTFPISLSHEIGGVGFIERENATILNSALQKSLHAGFQSLHAVLNKLHIDAPLYFTQNNGTILSLEDALQYPILTLSCGPTNSFVGSAKLAGLRNAIVVDIGGTSTDVGIVVDGFARRCKGVSTIAGIPLHFSMPDVLSIALGGGSYIKQSSQQLEAIGPESCAKQILSDAQAFGGSQLTVTDIGLKKKVLTIAGSNLDVINASPELVDQVLQTIRLRIQDLTRMIAGIHTDFPVIVTGGGAPLCHNTDYIIPAHASVANAYGAALAEISGMIDTVVSLTDRQQVLNDLTAQAYAQAYKRGAHPSTVRIVQQEIIPYHYVPHQMARVKITVAGSR